MGESGYCTCNYRVDSSAEHGSPEVNEQEKSPYEGLGFATALWLWGSIAWLAPGYIGFDGWGMWVCNIFGGISIAISFGGAAVEVGKLTDKVTVWSFSS